MEATENIYGTSLQGYIKASYEQLLKAFGPPNPRLCDNYKTMLNGLLNLPMVLLPLFTIGRMVITI
jgi:hypothetical protein